MAVRACLFAMDRRVVREAFTPEWCYPESKLVWALRALLVVLAVFSLVAQPRFTTRPLLFFSAVSGLLFSVGFAFVPTTRPRTLKAAEAATLVAFLAHVAGHAFGFYERFVYYDKVLHFLMPLAAALVLFALSQATRWIWSWRGVPPLPVFIYLFSMSVTLAALWEILEFAMDQLAGTDEQNGLFDTMVDIIMDVAGAAVGALVAALVTRYGERHGHDAVAEAPKRSEPRRAPEGSG